MHGIHVVRREHLGELKEIQIAASSASTRVISFVSDV
jgi:hypothetical protein